MVHVGPRGEMFGVPSDDFFSIQENQKALLFG